MAERIYKLNFSGPLHVGTWGIGREATLTYMPSDTLFSAFVTAWARLDSANLPAQLKKFLTEPGNPPLLLSSAFPFAGPVRFFPRPQRYVEVPENISYKRIKQAEWVSETIFNDLRQGRLPAEHLNETVNFIQRGTVWLTRPEREQISTALDIGDAPDDPGISLSLWNQATIPRVTIDRRSNASNLFHSGRINFTPGCGLWFAVRGHDFNGLKIGLNYLQDVGIGGLRGTGHGAFTYEEWSNAAALPEPDGDGYFVSLARYAPLRQELDTTLRAAQAAYKLTTVAGWCNDDAGHPWRRKRVRLVNEGAYLGWPGHIPGRLVDLTPEGVGFFKDNRRVYRYGLAFPVGSEAEV